MRIQPILRCRRPLLGAAALLLASFTVAAQSRSLIEVASIRESHNVGVNFAQRAPSVSLDDSASRR